MIICALVKHELMYISARTHFKIF